MTDTPGRSDSRIHVGGLREMCFRRGDPEANLAVFVWVSGLKRTVGRRRPIDSLDRKPSKVSLQSVELQSRAPRGVL